MTSQDRAIVATLTTTPQWVEEWQEYAALDDGGVLHTAEDKRKLAATLAEANELIAQAERRANAVESAWAEYEQAAKQARENADALLAEMRENAK